MPWTRPLRWTRQAAILWALALGTPAARAADADADALKSAFLYNFAQFVSWPAPPGPAFHLCIRGPDRLAAADALAGKSVAQARIRVVRSPPDDELRACHMLYLGAAARDEIDAILSALGKAPVLTVGDSPGATQRGVMINLVMEGRRIQFDVNKDNADQAGLRISAPLLRLARRVY
jgi:hypothetical protein